MAQGGEMSEEKPRAARWSLRKHPNSEWWTLMTDENLGPRLLVADCDSERVMPVFSGEAEAEMFAWLGGVFEDGWRVRKISAGELVSVLRGPRTQIRRAALDPPPEMVEVDAVSLVSVTRERFLGGVADSQRPLSGDRAHVTTLGGLMRSS
jgi:hypothetical protein